MHVRPGDYMRMGAPRDERVYEEISDTNKLSVVLGNYLDDYNLAHNTPMQLGECVTHTDTHTHMQT